MASEETKLAVLIEQVKEIAKDACDFVTKLEFNSRIGPLEKVVYGLVSAVLLGFLGAAIRFFIK